MDKVFSLTINSDIILYGAASIGVIMSNNLRNAGFNVCAFIDERSDEIDALNGTPVYGINQLKQLSKRARPSRYPQKPLTAPRCFVCRACR